MIDALSPYPHNGFNGLPIHSTASDFPGEQLLRTHENMSVRLQLAIHTELNDFHGAEQILTGKCPGTFLVFNNGSRWFFSIVQKGGHVEHKPFHKTAEPKTWLNGGAVPFPSFEPLMDHLLDGYVGIPYYPPLSLKERKFQLEGAPCHTGFVYASSAARNTLVYVGKDGAIHESPFHYDPRLGKWENGGANNDGLLLPDLLAAMMKCSPAEMNLFSCC